MDNEEEETDVRLQYGHSDIIHDSSCSNMPTSRETSVYIPAYYSDDNIPTHMIKCEDGHSKAIQEDIMRIHQSQIVNVHVNTEIRNVTVDEQLQGMDDIEYNTSFTNTYNMPTSTCNAREFAEMKQDPDSESDPGEFDGVREKTRQWIVDEDGLLKEVKTEPTNWVDETHHCTAVDESSSDSKVHRRRHTGSAGQRLVELGSRNIFGFFFYVGSMYI